MRLRSQVPPTLPPSPVSLAGGAVRQWPRLLPGALEHSIKRAGGEEGGGAFYPRLPWSLSPFVLQLSPGTGPAGLVARRKRGAAAAAAAARAFEKLQRRRQKVFRRRARLSLQTGRVAELTLPLLSVGAGRGVGWRPRAGLPGSLQAAAGPGRGAGSQGRELRAGGGSPAGSPAGGRGPAASHPGPSSPKQTPPAGRAPRPWSPSPTNCSSSCPS